MHLHKLTSINAVSARFISAEICRRRESVMWPAAALVSSTTAAGLPAKGTEEKASTWIKSTIQLHANTIGVKSMG